MHNTLSQFDQYISRLVAYIPGSWYSFMSAITWLGSPVVITILAGVLAVFAYVKGVPKISYAAGLTLVALMGNSVLKRIFQRDRPDTMYVENMIIESYSFPSGHAFGTAVFYSLIAYLAIKHLPEPFGMIAAIICALIIIVVGVSRIYLGAHFPSDVLVGWILGLISTFVIIRLLRI